MLLGDYLADHRFTTSRPSFRGVADVLAGLQAPLGVHAILGNHDWWEDAATQRGAEGLPEAAADFAAAGLPILHNEARRLVHQGRPSGWAGSAANGPIARSAAPIVARTTWRRRSRPSPTTRRPSCWRMSPTSSRASRSGWR